MRHGRRLPGLAFAAVAAVVVVAVTALAYAAFFAWDTRRDVDPVTGAVSGPYQPWQVISCAAVLVILAGLTVRFGRHRALVFLIPATFTLCWAIQAANSPGDGLWPVGAILVAFGTTAGAALFMLVPPSRRGS